MNKLKTVEHVLFYALIALLAIEGVRICPLWHDSDGSIVFLQCVLGIVALILPKILTRVLKFQLPLIVFIGFELFVLLAIYLGVAWRLYTIITHWDSILHFLSGFLLVLLGLVIYTKLQSRQNANNSNSTIISNKSNKVIMLIFCYSFAAALACLWEFWEFTGDLLLLTNMQRHSTSDGVGLVGKLALIDTMKDLILAAIGSLIMTTTLALLPSKMLE